MNKLIKFFVLAVLSVTLLFAQGAYALETSTESNSDAVVQKFFYFKVKESEWDPNARQEGDVFKDEIQEDDTKYVLSGISYSIISVEKEQVETVLTEEKTFKDGETIPNTINKDEKTYTLVETSNKEESGVLQRLVTRTITTSDKSSIKSSVYAEEEVDGVIYKGEIPLKNTETTSENFNENTLTRTITIKNTKAKKYQIGGKEFDMNSFPSLEDNDILLNALGLDLDKYKVTKVSGSNNSDGTKSIIVKVGSYSNEYTAYYEGEVSSDSISNVVIARYECRANIDGEANVYKILATAKYQKVENTEDNNPDNESFLPNVFTIIIISVIIIIAIIIIVIIIKKSPTDNDDLSNY